MKIELQCSVFASFIAVAEVTKPRRNLIELGLQALNNLWVSGHGDTDEMAIRSKRSMDSFAKRSISRW